MYITYSIFISYLVKSKINKPPKKISDFRFQLIPSMKLGAFKASENRPGPKRQRSHSKLF